MKVALRADDSSYTVAKPTGGQTPMPYERSTTPAWNPLSAVEEHTILDPSGPSDQPTVRGQPEHALLDPRLAGATVYVIETQDPSKTIRVTLHSDHGTNSIRKIEYHTSVIVAPDSVLPKHPNPTHDNGLLLIIRGENCGRYVRRLHHRHRPGKSTLIIVCVMDIRPGSQDVLTDTFLELEVDHLVVVDETAVQKKLNKNLMAEARKKYKSNK